MSEATNTYTGILELHPKGFGFLRDLKRHLAVRPQDPYVAHDLIRQYKLKEGVLVTGTVEPPRRGQNGPRLASIELIEGADPAKFHLNVWEDLTAIDPHQWLKLETGKEPLTTRVMDLFTPIGKGQRGLLVAPPRAGKTILLSHIATAIAHNEPNLELIVLLVDERPEEVTEMRRNVKGTVIASSSDQDTTVHVRTAQLVLERAKRLTEQGKDVLILLDSLTRLARAFNKHAGNSGRTLSGGVDSRALEIPKRLFGAARAFEEGGTLTILGTALIETGSRMDDVIFQEFKGTGNMELVLDRRLADRRIYPAIDLGQSGTRKEERLIPPERLAQITLLRRSLMQMRQGDPMEQLIKQLSKTDSNDEFLDTVSKFVSQD